MEIVISRKYFLTLLLYTRPKEILAHYGNDFIYVKDLRIFISRFFLPFINSDWMILYWFVSYANYSAKLFIQ